MPRYIIPEPVANEDSCREGKSQHEENFAVDGQIQRKGQVNKNVSYQEFAN